MKIVCIRWECIALLLATVLTPLLAQVNQGENSHEAALPQNQALAPIEDIPGLPRILLIGDSVSIGYTIQVRELLRGKANVHRIPVNGGSTANLSQLEAWLGTGKWDVIHFNFGLHDAKKKEDGTPQIERTVYRKNLTYTVTRLQATGAKLIWATTTPVPAVLFPSTRHFDDIPSYNEIALEVMNQKGVPIDDLYKVILPREAELQRPQDVHFTDEGYQLPAASVASSIEKQLKSGNTP